jgi:hypothetical protein
LGTWQTAIEHPRGQHHRARLGRELVDDLLDGDDRVLGGQHRLLLDPGEPPELHVALPVGLLGVDDRDVGVDGPHGGELLARERAVDEGDVLVVLGQVGAGVAAQRPEGEVRGARDVGVGQAGVGVLDELDRRGQPCSTASRMRCREPTPGLPP